jgi:hypothetical protein
MEVRSLKSGVWSEFQKVPPDSRLLTPDFFAGIFYPTHPLFVNISTNTTKIGSDDFLCIV